LALSEQNSAYEAGAPNAPATGDDSPSGEGHDGATAPVDNERYLQFTDVKKSYDQKVLVVRGFNLEVAKGEFITLLGPSGSGKTTMLMLLAGFESVTGGEIQVDGVPITRTPPYKRNIGMVFQNYALFPHMTVADNLAYPLKVRSMARADIDARVKEYLSLVELEAFADRHPGQLSGGQRQRVALARALIFEPSLVLMDEPLGALDKKLREQMQFEITSLHKKLGFTVIYVTHDQSEALTMSDRVVVFNGGVVQQCAPPNVLYEQPANAFVADFIGENNMIGGKIISVTDGQVRVALSSGGEVVTQAADITEIGSQCIVSVRPEKMFIKPSDHAYDNQIEARFLARHYVGDFIRYYFELADNSEITIKVLNDAAAPIFKDGQTAELIWQTQDCFAFKSA
jgi:putative spermidine/putrescine transport system ATP-binding protein